MPPGVVTSLPGYQSLHRVSNVIYAIKGAEPVAFNTIALRLGGITLDDIRPILANILKDIALYVGGSTVVGAVIGGAIGSLAFGAGAVPGAVAGASAGAEVGNLILTFTGLKSIAIYLKDAVPAACRYYKKGFKEAWGRRFQPQAIHDVRHRRLRQRPCAVHHGAVDGHRGLSDTRQGQPAIAACRSQGQRTAGPKMATWLEQNEGKLLNNPELRQPMRSEGGGGGGDAPAPKPDIPRPMRGSSPPVAAAAAERAKGQLPRQRRYFPISYRTS